MRQLARCSFHVDGTPRLNCRWGFDRPPGLPNTQTGKGGLKDVHHRTACADAILHRFTLWNIDYARLSHGRKGIEMRL
jgi:hypothetical protein